MIELPVLWMDEKDCQLEELGIETPPNHDNTVTYCFININAIAPVVVDGRNYTLVYANGEEFTATIPYSEVMSLLEKDGKLLVNVPLKY